MGSSFGVGKRKHDSDSSDQDDASQSLEMDNRQLMIIDVSATHHEGEFWTDEEATSKRRQTLWSLIPWFSIFSLVLD
jgi:hypothetical protein